MSKNKTSWRIVTMLFATATAGYICRVNVATAGPLLMNEFGLSQVAMGRVFSSFLLGYALFQVPAGALSDRWGSRRVLALAAWMWVVFTILQTLVGLGIVQTTAFSALAAFLVCRFMLGITAAPTYPGSAQGISRWVLPKFQGRANAIVITSVGLGSALAPPIVANVMVHFGWRIALLASAIPALAIALIWTKIREPQIINDENIETKTDSSLQNKNNGLRSGSFILLTISYSLQGYVGYIFINWFYLYLVQERHFGLLSGAWMSSLPWVLSIISIPLGGYISDRLVSGRLGYIWGRRLIPIIGMASSGILISMGAHTQNAIMAAVSLAFATACVLCVEGPFWASMIRIAGPRSGTGGGIMNMGCNIGGLISPALTPLLATIIGWENALHVAAILAIIAALLWFWIKPVMQNT
jgi:ACS family glucarate transporter-like MFS transporter